MKAVSYFWYMLTARSKYSIHSPFVYDLVTKVFNDKTHYQEYQQVDQLRRKLQIDQNYINKTDLGTGVNKTTRVSSIAKGSAVSSKYGKLLYRLVKYFKPTNVLELGTSFGISTCYVTTGNREIKVTTIEGCPETAAIAKKNFDELALSNINLIIDDFDNILPNVLDEIPQLDLVFFDGNHKQDTTLKYFDLCLQKKHNDSIFIFDDIHWSKDMDTAWNKVKDNQQVTVSIDLFQFGLIFFRKEQTKEHYVIRY